jgi:hypothetical protein
MNALVSSLFIETFENEIAQPITDDHEHTRQTSRAFSLGDAIDGYEYCPERKQYIPVDSLATEDTSSSENTTIDTVDSSSSSITTSAANDEAIHSITDEIDALLAAGALNNITQQAATGSSSSSPFNDDFVIFEALYFWDVPRQGGLQYALGNDGELYWYSPETYDFLRLTESDVLMFAEDYPASCAALDEILSVCE